MTWFLNLKIGRRLAIGFALVTLVGLVIATFGRVSLGLVHSEFELLTSDRIVKVEQLAVS